MEEDIWVFLFFMFIASIILGSIFISMGILEPLRDDNAQKECELLEFETFVSYNVIMFQTTPKALICGTIKQRLVKEGKIKEYISNGKDIIVQEVRP